jgi:fatty acid desaturase
MSERTLSQGQSPQNGKAEKKHRLPAFLDHFNGRDLKVFFRCWVALWVASLLMFITPTLQNIGTATFFAALVLVMLPPSGIVFIYVLGALSLLIGIFLSWAWGVIVMKAAQAARPAADTQARMASLQQTAAAQANSTGVPVASIAQKLVYDGYMLDARVTSVTYCLLCLFIYLMVWPSSQPHVP